MSGSHRLATQRKHTATFYILAAIVAILVAGILVLISGGHDGSHPSSTLGSGPTASVAHSPSVDQAQNSQASTPEATRTKDVHQKPAHKSRQTLTYVVQHGDSLSSIAWAYHMHSYKLLYTWNKAKIGKNPGLIFAGEKLIVHKGDQ